MSEANSPGRIGWLPPRMGEVGAQRRILQPALSRPPLACVAMMRTSALSRASAHRRVLLNKVPEVTIWFWIIKILCTTVGESFADWINMQLGVGLTRTALISTAVLVVVIGVQFACDRYVPVVYWLTVVVVSVTGTLYTDILTDTKGV